MVRLSICPVPAADRRKSEELSEQEEGEEEELQQAAVEVVGEMQLTAEQLKVMHYQNQADLLDAIRLRHQEPLLISLWCRSTGAVMCS